METRVRGAVFELWGNSKSSKIEIQKPMGFNTILYENVLGSNLCLHTFAMSSKTKKRVLMFAFVWFLAFELCIWYAKKASERCFNSIYFIWSKQILQINYNHSNNAWANGHESLSSLFQIISIIFCLFVSSAQFYVIAIAFLFNWMLAIVFILILFLCGLEFCRSFPMYYLNESDLVNMFRWTWFASILCVVFEW